jgi:hypothetical protein
MNLLLFTHKKISIKINIYKLLVEISGKMRVMRLFRIRIRVGWIWRIFFNQMREAGIDISDLQSNKSKADMTI